jgi:glycosyltransferase involved in cell wall biosynthesis
MKVAVNLESLGADLASLNRVTRTLQQVVALRHELVRFPAEYHRAPPTRQRGIAEDVLAASDVILSPPDGAVLAARDHTGSGVPVAHLLMGCMPRGAFLYPSIARHPRSTDVLVANSRADAGIARAFYPEARVEMLPFSYDDTAFAPVTEQEAARARAESGIPADAPLVIYAGRSTLEKNVHTVIRVFSLVLQEVPDAHLVLAGPVENYRFEEFGVFPLEMRLMLHRVCTGLGIAGRVHPLQSLDAARLRALYGAADVALNLTLHHDENFGLAQVEAAACGTPVVGTQWGGLKDTVAEGVTGLGVSTWNTAHGVKASWWEAANHVVRLLRDRKLRDRLGRSAREHALQHYSTEAHAEAVEAVVRAAAEGIGKPWQPLEPSALAKEFWNTCAPRAGDRSMYMRGPRSMELYRAMIDPYTGTSPAGLPLDAPVEGKQVLSLATPLLRRDDGTIEINDPIFPLQAVVPDEHRDAVWAALELLDEEPAVEAARLLAALGTHANAGGAVEWMMEAGLVVRSAAGFGCLDPRGISRKASVPVITIRAVDYPADVLIVR